VKTNQYRKVNRVCRCLSILAGLLLLSVPSAVKAQLHYGDFYYKINNGTVTIIGYSGYQPVDLI
jgi:hypothetical protein